MTTKKRIYLHMTMTPQMIQQVRMAAAEAGKPMTQWVRDLVTRELLERQVQ